MKSIGLFNDIKYFKTKSKKIITDKYDTKDISKRNDFKIILEKSELNLSLKSSKKQLIKKSLLIKKQINQKMKSLKK